MSKFKRLQKVDYQLLEVLYKYKYLDFNYIKDNIYTSYRLRKTLLTRLRKIINEGLIVNYINTNNNFTEVDSVIYALTEEGYNLVHYKYDYHNFDKQSSIRLKQGYEHNLVVLHIMSRYKRLDSGSLYFSERESFQRLGKKQHEVIRPDGVIISSAKSLIVIEYEHSNLKRDLYIKLTRYNDYFQKGLYRFNYSFGEYFIKKAVLHLVTSKPLSNVAIERIKSLDLKYIITSCTAQEMLDDVLNESNYKVIYVPVINK